MRIIYFLWVFFKMFIGLSVCYDIIRISSQTRIVARYFSHLVISLFCNFCMDTASWTSCGNVITFSMALSTKAPSKSKLVRYPVTKTGKKKSWNLCIWNYITRILEKLTVKIIFKQNESKLNKIGSTFYHFVITK